MNEFETTATVCKVDESLGLIFGFAIICKQAGKPYFDLQDDHIPEDAMLRATTKFMQGARPGNEMHRVDDGMVVFSFPLTTDIAKALDIETPTTGWLIAMKPDDPEILAKAARGEYRGFSIGGFRIRDEDA